MVLGRSRRIIEETILWASTREAFGKKLINQPVIQSHIGEMVADFQATYAQYEKLTGMYNTMSKAEANAKLGGPTAILKYKCTRMSTLVSDRATQVLGGRGVSKYCRTTLNKTECYN